MKEEIRSNISESCLWRESIHWFSTIDSTNTRAKEMARQGAPAGTVLIAGTQTGGRGRLGRSFSSPEGMGVYLSCILRPQCTPDRLMHLTCAAAAAMVEAVAKASGLTPGIKWTNDRVVGKRKLGGILTELSVSQDTGLVEYAIVGIGINCLQQKQDFPVELQGMATSLAMSAPRKTSPARLAGAMVEALYQMDSGLLTEKHRIMDLYRTHCMTVGQDIQVVRGNEIRLGKALELTEDGGLVVQYHDGTTGTVTSGEVSVRGMYGYM